jgi:hypothetical protein
MTGFDMATVRRIVTVIAMACIFSGLGWDIYLDLSYAAGMPQAPDPSSGRTDLILVNHNTRVYVTEAEYQAKIRADHFFFGVGALSLLVIVLLNVRFKRS